MRGHIREREKGVWSVVTYAGRHPKSGKKQYRWATAYGTRKDAEKVLTAQLAEVDAGMNVDPSTMKVGEWFDTWIKTVIEPDEETAPRTVETYRSVVEHHLRPALGRHRLQKLTSIHVMEYYAEKRTGLSQTTLQQHQAILHRALRDAKALRLVSRNVAADVPNKPRSRKTYRSVADDEVWTAEEVRKVLKAAREMGPQPSAFYTLALETGMRKAELCGLKWKDVDLDHRTIDVVRQLRKPGAEPLYGPPKNGRSRVIHISERAVQLLYGHKRAQAELKIANRIIYRDHGLAFCKEWSALGRNDHLGEPLQMNNLGQREFAQLIKKAGVKTITFHGMRHTCATLALEANVPAKVVQERLGHKDISVTLDTYTHALESMQQDAAERLSKFMR